MLSASRLVPYLALLVVPVLLITTMATTSRVDGLLAEEAPAAEPAINDGRIVTNVLVSRLPTCAVMTPTR